jgi:SAM-dependent methyltransferase
LKGKFPDSEFYRADVSSDADIAFLIGTKEFDVVSAFDVLFHLVDDNRYEKAIKNIHSMLKPNGFFVFSDNFIHGPTIRSNYQVSRSLSHIEKTLIENGFDIIQRRPMFVLMNTPVDTTKRASKRVWRALSLLLQRHGLPNLKLVLMMLLTRYLKPVISCTQRPNNSPKSEFQFYFTKAQTLRYVG